MIVFIIDISNYSLNWKKCSKLYFMLMTLQIWKCNFLIIWTIKYLETKSLTSCDVCFTHAQYIYTRHIENHVHQKSVLIIYLCNFKNRLQTYIFISVRQDTRFLAPPSRCDHALIIYHVKGLYLSIFTKKGIRAGANF